MSQLNSLFILIISLFVVSCASKKNINKTPESVYKYTNKQASKIYFNILQLNDIFKIKPEQNIKFEKIARVENLRKNLIKEDNNTMFVVAGNFLPPVTVTTPEIDNFNAQEQKVVEVLNAMNANLVTFGNNELGLNYSYLQETLNESHFDWISSNVLHNKNGRHHYFYKVINGRKENLNDSYIKEFYGSNGAVVRVGFISASSQSLLNTYVYYGDIYEEIKRAYFEIKDKVDIVIGLTNLTIEEDKKLASLLPNISLIMGGNTYLNSYDKIGNVVITKADSGIKTAYVHRFEYDPISKNIQLKSQLKEITTQTPVNSSIQTLIKIK
ncbi:hypothetical protein [Tenacibaculum aestuariivivum]|uniref:hypothetical protein n=1 Tax=Tenacibaculum aestuariivivum TaxID=2006131 RepID=UPI003AB4AA03